MSCKFQHIFGKPGEGVHAARIGGVALVDTALTVAAAWGLSRWWGASFWAVLVLLLVLGLVVHRWLCVDTTLTRLVFGPHSQ